MNEIKLDDWLAWRRKQYQHDEAGNVICSQVCGSYLRNVKQPAKMPMQLLAGGSPNKIGNLAGAVINRSSGKATLYQQLCKPLKLLFGFFSSHKRAKWPNLY